MRKSGFIGLLIFIAVAAALLFLPYVEYYHLLDTVIVNTRFESAGFGRLADNMISEHDVTPWWLSLTPFTPFALLVESTVLSENKRNRHRLLFILQGLVFILFGFLTYVGMNIILVPHHYLMNYYLIILHSAVISIWCILLGIPFFDSSKLINNTFRNLSLFNH